MRPVSLQIAADVARREFEGFARHGGTPRCAVCGRVVGRDEAIMRIHDVPVHAGCAGYQRRP